MPFRRRVFKFDYRSTNRQAGKFLENELDSTYLDKIFPQIPFLVREKAYRIKSVIENNPAGQLKKLAWRMTDLIRDERCKFSYSMATELRPHVQLVLTEAMRNGDCHRPTMDLMNFWICEKNLIHKVFKVLVPRYRNWPGSFTALHVLGIDYNSCIRSHRDLINKRFSKGGEAILELRGNPLPPVPRPQVQRHGLLSNVLIDCARAQFLREQQLEAEQAARRAALESATVAANSSPGEREAEGRQQARLELDLAADKERQAEAEKRPQE